MKKDHRTKMQRQAASKRKTWTNALRFLMKQRNERRNAVANNEAERTAKRLLAEAEQEIAAEGKAKATEGLIELHEEDVPHEHGEHCDHG